MRSHSLCGLKFCSHTIDFSFLRQHASATITAYYVLFDPLSQTYTAQMKKCPGMPPFQPQIAYRTVRTTSTYVCTCNLDQWSGFPSRPTVPYHTGTVPAVPVATTLLVEYRTVGDPTRFWFGVPSPCAERRARVQAKHSKPAPPLPVVRILR